MLTLGLCIGANLTIFAVLDALVIRALPFPDPDRLVVLHNAYRTTGVKRAKATITNYYERRELDVFESIAMFQERPFIVGEAGSTRRVDCAMITPQFFRVLGVPLAMGQPFTEDQLTYASDKVAIITDQFWRDAFNADPNVLGRTVMMDGLPFNVIAVLPPEFRYLSHKTQIFRPLGHWPEIRDPMSNFAPEDRLPDGRRPVGRYSEHARTWDGQMIARLAVNQSIGQAQAQLDALNARLMTQDPLGETPRAAGYHTWIEPLREHHVHSVKPVVLLVQAGALLLLLLGAVNLAGLLVIRASGRAKEMAIRQALGASRLLLARGILVETIMLALSGGILGVLLAIGGIRLALTLGADALPLGADIAFDSRTAMVSILVSVAIGISIALPIIWYHLHGSTTASLSSESRGATTNRSVQNLRRGLIVTQIAMACVLLHGSGLLGLSLKRTLEKPSGFEPDQVFSGELKLPWVGYHGYQDGVPDNTVFVKRLLNELRAVPGVSYAAVSTAPPFTTAGSATGSILVEGTTPSAGDVLRSHYVSTVTEDYWKAMGIPLVKGRFLEPADIKHSGPRNAVIDQALANLYWPDGGAIGQRFSADPSAFHEKSAFTVVGIVGNVKQLDLSETTRLGAAYLPYSNLPRFQVIVRAPVSVTTMAATLQRVVRQIDPGLPIENFKSMQMRIDDSLITRRSPAILAIVFASVALLLAGIGIYGVLAYAVSQRRREIGVRMALGALKSQVSGLFLAMGLRLLLIGGLIGLCGAWISGRLMQSLLFDVPPGHLPTLALTTFLMSCVTLFACLHPAMKASRVDPMETLRSE